MSVLEAWNVPYHVRFQGLLVHFFEPDSGFGFCRFMVKPSWLGKNRVLPLHGETVMAGQKPKQRHVPLVVDFFFGLRSHDFAGSCAATMVHTRGFLASAIVPAWLSSEMTTRFHSTSLIIARFCQSLRVT